MSYSIAFLGTHHPAVETFRALAAKNWIAVLVLPREAGEKNVELEQIAATHRIPVTYEVAELLHYSPNLLLAANYPKLVPSHITKRIPSLNTHWSMLPRYRGVHGTAWAIINGEESVGCTLHWMSDAFDEGDIISQEKVEITPDLSLLELHQRLGELQAKMVVNLLENGGTIEQWPRQSQIHSDATYVPQRFPEDGLIDWSWPSKRIGSFVKILPTPDYPGAFTYFEGRKLIVAGAREIACPPYYSTPGQVVRSIRGTGVWVKTGDTCIEIRDVVWDDAKQPLVRADKCLKRGDKLGYEPQREIHNLKSEIASLRKEIESLREL